MGIDYSLRFAYPDAAAVTAALRRVPFVRELVSPAVGFEIRTVGNAGEMPDATVKVEPYGAYFCVYGGHGREMLGVVIARLVGEFGAVTITELE